MYLRERERERERERAEYPSIDVTYFPASTNRSSITTKMDNIVMKLAQADTLRYVFIRALCIWNSEFINFVKPYDQVHLMCCDAHTIDKLNSQNPGEKV